MHVIFSLQEVAAVIPHVFGTLREQDQLVNNIARCMPL